MTETHRDPARDPRIARLPIDPRTALPIPFTAGTLPNGQPVFSIVNAHKMIEILKRDLCGVCGQRLGSWLAFIGG